MISFAFNEIGASGNYVAKLVLWAGSNGAW